MLTAITHKLSPLINNCELTFLQYEKIDFEKAKLQHQKYCKMLTDCGVKVLTLDENTNLPDSTFVEDTALVLDEIAIITPMGVASRQTESKLIEKELAKFRPIAKIKSPAKIEGGDILRIGKKIFVGNSTRTNIEGIRALSEIVKPFGFNVFEVKNRNSLHLKTACTALDHETILLNPNWIDPEPFKQFNKIEVLDEEPFAANILKIKDNICIHSGFSKTLEKLQNIGYKTKTTDISEFLKAEAGLTCLSLIFDSY